MKRMIPWAMVWLRVGLAPLMVFGAMHGLAGWLLAGVVLVASADDILDGMVARAWGVDTPSLRLADSTADTVFYLGVAWALWVRSPSLLRANGWLLAGLLGLEALRYGVDFAKFGKGASYHSYLAKAWGLVLASAMVGAFELDRAGWLVRSAIVLGTAVNLESLAMSLMLPRWQNDVKTLWAARRLRDRMVAEEEQRRARC